MTEEIRNFCIIAHIDHGKSTLADRFLDITKTITERQKKEQFLDSMSLERERGVTIKMHPVTMKYQHGGKNYMLNLIDTPGHVDFSYEVSRSLAAVEGAILLVDASQGVQAQTLANLYQAMEHDLVIIPVLNKIDLPAANVELATKELVDLLGVDESEILQVSAKEGTGVEEILKKVIEKVPAPATVADENLKALVFDSVYDTYRGVVLYVRLFNGTVKKNEKLMLMVNKTKLEALEVGIFKPQLLAQPMLEPGQIGYIVTDLREVAEAKVGETVTHEKSPAVEALPGMKETKPFVFASFFPASQEDYPKLKTALSKLQLSDASFSYEAEAYGPMGHGFRMGFLGLLHLEIILERLKREYDLDLITTLPHVSYMVNLTDGTALEIKNPSFMPDTAKILSIEEPWVAVDIVTPATFLGPVMELGRKFRGEYKKTEYLEETRAHLFYEFPLSKILAEFYDQLKSASQGYASMNYEFAAYRVGDLKKLDVLVAGDLVDPLSQIVYEDEAVSIGNKIVERLKELIPRQQFKIALQAAIGARIVAREDIPAARKDVTAKLYGGDVSRKKKLLEKQKKGKARMKSFGSVEIPSEVFSDLLKNN